MGYLLFMVSPNWQILFIVQIRILMMPFERCVSKLLENNIIVEIGSTEFKLWQLKRIIKLRGGESCS